VNRNSFTLSPGLGQRQPVAVLMQFESVERASIVQLILVVLEFVSGLAVMWADRECAVRQYHRLA
jgi:hypothetical protein